MDENFSAAHRSARLQGIPAGSKHRARQLEDLPDCLTIERSFKSVAMISTRQLLNNLSLSSIMFMASV